MHTGDHNAHDRSVTWQQITAYHTSLTDKALYKLLNCILTLAGQAQVLWAHQGHSHLHTVTLVSLFKNLLFQSSWSHVPALLQMFFTKYSLRLVPLSCLCPPIFPVHLLRVMRASFSELDSVHVTPDFFNLMVIKPVWSLFIPWFRNSGD